MVVLDLLGRRTALRVLWELRQGPLTFRALQEACETNTRLLNTRLVELRASRLIEHNGAGYVLTAEGRELAIALEPLSSWAGQWAKSNPGAFETLNDLVK